MNSGARADAVALQCLGIGELLAAEDKPDLIDGNSLLLLQRQLHRLDR